MRNKLDQRLMGVLFVFMASIAAWGAKTMYPYEYPYKLINPTDLKKQQALGLTGDEYKIGYEWGNGAGLGCTLARPGMTLEPGKWYTDFEVCKKYADDNGMPLFAVWSNHGCVHCWYTDAVFIQKEFQEWQKTNNAGKVIYCFMAGGEAGLPDQQTSMPIAGLTLPGSSANVNAYNWMWKGGRSKLDEYPFVALWWKKKGINDHFNGDNICRGSAAYDLNLTTNTYPLRVKNVIAQMEKSFSGWSPDPPYAGGKIDLSETVDNRLEAEASTTSVTLDLVRDDAVADVVTNNYLSVYSRFEDEVLKTNVLWAAGETRKTLTLDVSQVFATQTTPQRAYLRAPEDGDRGLLVVSDADNVPLATNTITYVAGNSVKNPLWIGETFDYGDWTMDFAAATNKVAAADGDAYTLAVITGSLWCPDCANTERNFLGVEKDGENRFRAWAAANNVALVSIDMPAFTNATIDCPSPTLLSRTPYATVLARAREYPDSGADASETNAVLRSGLGYLTRKGVSDEAAREALERNRSLVAKDSAACLFNLPEDKNSFRTGVPIFVLLRKDGTVAARLTRFAAVSPMASARDDWDNVIKRFDEMLAIARGGAHGDNIANNHVSTTKDGFQADGGAAAGEVSHTDFTDVFKLQGMTGGVLQGITVSGASVAEVVVAIVETNANGSVVRVAEATGKLSDGVKLEAELPTGDYFVQVSGASITNAAFAVENPNADNFHAYAISGSVILVPTEVTATVENDLSKVTIRLVKDTVYRIVGLTCDPAVLTAVDGGGDLYVALVSEDVELDKPEAKADYQIWKPGTVGFQKPNGTVSEAIGAYAIPVARTGGVSGEVSVKVKVNLDTDKTTLYATTLGANGEFERKPRFTFEETELVWAEGEDDVKYVYVTVLDDDTFDGEGDVVLDISRETGASELGMAEYTLMVKDNDKQSAGKVAFTGADPFFSKKATVYVKEGAKAVIKADRFEGTDGEVSVLAKATKGTLGGAVKDGGRVTWINRDGGEKDIELAGLTKGQTSSVTLSQPLDGVKIVSASNKVTVVCVSADALAFETLSQTVSLQRYIASSNVFALAETETTVGKVTFTKLSGTLPAGLKATYDGPAFGLAIHGTPTAKAGTYTVVYQVRNGSVAGLTQQITFVISDPTSTVDGVAPENGGNASVAKARTFKDVAVIDPDAGTLVGLLQLTIPTKGNLSAKFAGTNGTVSLSTKSWSGFDADSKALTAALANKKGYVLAVACSNDFSVALKLTTPDAEVYEATISAEDMWSKDAPATAWVGSYTAVLQPTKYEEETANLAPRGVGYLTFKMTKSGAMTGRMTWAGCLPNGTALSGSSIIGNVTAVPREGAVGEDLWAKLPIFKTSSRDVVSLYARILADAEATGTARSVYTADEAEKSYWAHRESKEVYKADYEIDFAIYGGYFSTTNSLAACCEEDYETTSPELMFDTAGLDGLSVGPLTAPDPVTVTVDAKTLKLPTSSSAKPAGLTMSFSRTTGVATGSVRLPYGEDGKYVTAQWRGVLVQGWGEGCNCAPGTENIFLPFVSGFYYLTDRYEYESGKKVSVKRGGAVEIK